MFSVENIDIEQGFSDKREMYLSEIATDIEYVPLETTDESLISSVSKVITHQNYIIVLDKKIQADFVFDRSGKFIRKIGAVGNGPGEYIGIADISIRHRDSVLCIYDDQTNRLSSYSLSGKFIKAVRTPFNADKTAFINDSTLCLLLPRPCFVFNQSYSLAIYDHGLVQNGRLISRSDENITEREASSMPTTGMTRLEKWVDSLSYWEVKYDIIYRITNHKTAIPRYFIRYKNKIPFQRDFSRQTIEEYTCVDDMLETNSFFFFHGVHNGLIFQIVYDKGRKAAVNVHFNYRDDDMASRFLNDLDGGSPFWPKGVLEDGRVYSAVELYSLREYLKETPFRNIHPKTDSLAVSLNALIAKSEFMDNPCLMFVKLK
jgi:hypothetical protein